MITIILLTGCLMPDATTVEEMRQSGADGRVRLQELERKSNMCETTAIEAKISDKVSVKYKNIKHMNNQDVCEYHIVSHTALSLSDLSLVGTDKNGAEKRVAFGEGTLQDGESKDVYVPFGEDAVALRVEIK